MAMQARLVVQHSDAFPAGAYLKGAVEKVIDFEASKGKAPDERVQAVDLNKRGEGTGLPMWQVMVLDADDEAGKKETAITVKIAAKVQPVPPENKTSFPWTPVEFVGLTALPYIDDSAVRLENGQLKGRARIVWSYRAEGMVAPGSAATSGARAAAKDAA